MKIVDYGETFNLDEWNWYMEFSFKEMVPFDVKLSNFDTRMQGNIAYTSFRMGAAQMSKFEVANAVLKRIDGQWRIDFLSIENGQKWLPWLRARLNKGQDVTNWYADLKEHPYQ